MKILCSNWTDDRRASNLPINNLAAVYTWLYIVNKAYLYSTFLGGARTSRLDQNSPHEFLYIPQLWEICTTSVQPTAELQICLYLTMQLYTYIAT